ncbi:MAG: hypothetical protein J5716_07915, partial [Alphaproteobacteria bacterium]|nr:hypothetical protein [Alphaproteobacteria bacterium]
MLRKIYKFVRQFTLPIIVFLFLLYCFLNKSLWTDFHGYLLSFEAPIRKGILAVTLFLAVSYISRKTLNVIFPRLFRRLRLNNSTENSINTIFGYFSIL